MTKDLIQETLEDFIGKHLDQERINGRVSNKWLRENLTSLLHAHLVECLGEDKAPATEDIKLTRIQRGYNKRAHEAIEKSKELLGIK